jgi:hypothetical protein
VAARTAAWLPFCSRVSVCNWTITPTTDRLRAFETSLIDGAPRPWSASSTRLRPMRDQTSSRRKATSRRRQTPEDAQHRAQTRVTTLVCDTDSLLRRGLGSPPGQIYDPAGVATLTVEEEGSHGAPR